MRYGLVLCTLVAICVALWMSRLLEMLGHRTRAIAVLLLVLASPIGVLEFLSHRSPRTTDAPVSSASAPAWARTGEGINDSPKENSRIDKWKTGVEQALMEAKSREPERQPDAVTNEGVSASVAQEAKATQIDFGTERKSENMQAEVSSAINEAKVVAKTRAANGSSTVNEVKTTKWAKETKASGLFIETSQTVGGSTKETAEAEAARKDAIARHAFTYSWVTTDGTGRRWVHTRPIIYRP